MKAAVKTLNGGVAFLNAKCDGKWYVKRFFML